MAWLLPGELKQSIDEALAGGCEDTVEQRIHKLLQENPVMLFMKGPLVSLPASMVIMYTHPVYSATAEIMPGPACLISGDALPPSQR